MKRLDVCLPHRGVIPWIVLLLLSAPGNAPADWDVGWEESDQPSIRLAGRGQFLPALGPPWAEPRIHSTPLADSASLGFGGTAAMNRVDGFSLLGVQELRNRGWLPNLRIYEGYGFSSERWSGAAEVRVRPLGDALAIGGRWFDETAPWQLPVQALTPEEHFLAMLFLREDYADYLRRRGAAAFVEWRPEMGRGVVASWSEERHRSLKREVAKLGPFGGSKTLPSNPPVDEALWHLLRIRGSWAFGFASEVWEVPDAHAALAEVTAAGGAIGDGPEFLRFWLEQRGRQRLTPSQFLGYRISAGWASGGDRFSVADQEVESRLPRQWSFQAGGVGSLRGHKFQEFEGDRLLLATLEYGLLFADRQIRPIVFLDGGKAWYQASDASGGISGSGPLALDGGLGLQLGTSHAALRIDVARNLRAERTTARVTVRLGFPY